MPSAALVTLAACRGAGSEHSSVSEAAGFALCACCSALHRFPCPGLFPPPPPRPFVFTASASILWSGWLGLLFAEGKCQTVLWSFFWFFPSSGTVFQLEQERSGALARSSIHTHSAVMGESLLAGLGMAGTTSAFGPQPECKDVKMDWQELV